ncbi:MAG: UDP-N-acetylmuramate dehydrogenase [Oscillospiraceae bacterium]
MIENIYNIAKLLKNDDIEYNFDENLKEHCTFKIGGNASIFCKPKNNLQLCKTIKILSSNNIVYFLLGKGSNVLFADEGFFGAVVRVPDMPQSICVNGNTLSASAGTDLAKVCKAARDAELSGIEFAFGIPGSIGGAVFMNAGAFGGEMKDILINIDYFDGNEIKTIEAKDAEFGYRTSIFNKNPWCVLSASFTLKKALKSDINDKMKEYAQKRKDKQPLDLPSAGSAFKRPIGAFAGALIDNSGLRGYTVGGAAISDKHCGFIVNLGEATCKDVLQLADEVCNKVKDKTGYTLEKEIRVISCNGKMDIK